MAAERVDDIFDAILDRVRALDPENTRNWFQNLKPLRFSGGLLAIACPDDETAGYLRDNMRGVFTNAAQQITGHLVGVEFRVNPEVQTQAVSVPNAFAEFQLHPDYTFENFVVGPSNRLAHASCVAISQSPGDTYNPLFLYGNSGLGKTHLLHAVCRFARQERSASLIAFLSCEDFVNRFIKAIGEGNLLGFQQQFRSADILVIDDVQFLSEREQSQEEFFHTFNALYNNGKQIILSSDRSPAEIQSLEDRLISRFNWGLVARIDPPTFETRVAIVQRKAELRGMELPEEIAQYIARKKYANIRELEGGLTAIHAVATTTGAEITMELAQTALDGQIEPSVRHINITDIIDVVVRHFGVRLADLQSKKRSQSVAEPRQICMYLARQLTKHSLEEIGGHLGGRDHTTVMHAVNKITKVRESDPPTKAVLDDLEKQITQTVTVQ